MTPEQAKEWEQFRSFMQKRAATSQQKGQKQAQIILECMNWHEREIARLTSEVKALEAEVRHHTDHT